MSGSGSSSSGCAQKQAIAFGQPVKQAVPNGHSNNSIPCDEVIFHNPPCDSRFKKKPVTVVYSQEPHLGEPPDLPSKATLQSPQSSNQSEIKIVQVWSMAVEKDPNSVDNSHQYSNLMEQVSQIIPADNLSNIDASQTVQTQESLVHSEAVAIRTNWEGKAHIKKHVSYSSGKTTDNKATRLERRREHQRELRKDPAYVERERKRKREWEKKRCQTDPDYIKRQNERKRERYRNDLALAERHRKRQRERYRNDPAFAERERERQRVRRKDLAYAKHQRECKKQHCQSVNSAETTQSSSKNSEGTAPRFSVVKLKEYLQPRSTTLSLSERSAIEKSEDTGHFPLDRQTA